MTTINADALLAMVPLLEKQVREKLALDIVFAHEIGCTCAMCESLRTRFPIANADHPDRFAEQGGEHQTAPFDATNTAHLASISKSLHVLAVAVESVRDVLRGRDSENKVVPGPIRAIADFLLRGQQTAPPQTQRTPAQQAAAPQAQATQANPYTAQKRVATDAEMARFKTDQKVRFDPKNWPGDRHKGRTMLQCEPNFLEIYADSIEYFAGEAKKKVAAGSVDDGDKRDAQWGEMNAAQYRRLAADMRSGKVQQAPVVPAYAGGSDSLI